MASAAIELPTQRTPGWEFTPLKGLDLDAFTAPADGGDAGLPLLAIPAEAIRIDQVDATWTAPGEGLPDGVTVLPLALATEQHPELVERHLGAVVSTESDPFAQRNIEAWDGGAFVHVAAGIVLQTPIALTVTHGAGTALTWRSLVVLEDGAQAEVWEQYASQNDAAEGLLNTVTELVVGENASLRYVCAQGLSEQAWIFGSQRAVVARDGSLDWVALGFGGKNGKVRMDTNLAGRGADARVTGAYATHSRQHVDFDTFQEHAAPDTHSDLAFRGLLHDRSSTVWRGMIKVDEGAQRTDAFQECRNLLLSKKAHADAIPGLEILADDVRCTHAAAIAQIDPEQLFYLRSRGLDDATATSLIVEGFLQSIVERFPAGAMRDAVGSALEQRLERVLGTGV